MARFDPQLIGEKIGEAMELLRVPGVAMGLLYEGEEYAAGFGIINAEHPLPVDADTLFRIASITKSFTGTAVMRLVESGQLDLHTPLRVYLPELRLADEDVARRVTLQHLLTHTAGWVGDWSGEVDRSFRGGDDALARSVAKLAELPQLTPMGEVWSYNSLGFYLAGRVIEVVTGQSYEVALEELLLAPLGMTRTFFHAEEAITHRAAVGHAVADEGWRVLHGSWAWPRARNAAGGLVSCARDLLRYVRFHLGDGSNSAGQRLLSLAGLARMDVPLVPAGSMCDAGGLSWWVWKMDGGPVVGHSGVCPGQRATVKLAPKRNFGIVVLTNGESGDELHAEVTAWALRHYLGISEPERVPLQVPESRLAEYVGRYTGWIGDIDVRLEKGELLLQLEGNRPPVRLAFYAVDRAVGQEAPFQNSRMEFLRSPASRVVWLRLQGRIHARVSAE
jgi:CubicO group peptidase (beta-lactamase class C family)